MPNFVLPSNSSKLRIFVWPATFSVHLEVPWSVPRLRLILARFIATGRPERAINCILITYLHCWHEITRSRRNLRESTWKQMRSANQCPAHALRTCDVIAGCCAIPSPFWKIKCKKLQRFHWYSSIRQQPLMQLGVTILSRLCNLKNLDTQVWIIEDLRFCLISCDWPGNEYLPLTYSA